MQVGTAWLGFIWESEHLAEITSQISSSVPFLFPSPQNRPNPVVNSTSPNHAMLPAEAAAEKLRQDGNAYFKKEKYNAAIDAYTEAITLCPNVAVYWTNRAICHRKRNEWTRVEEDCRRAIELDHGSVKAYYLLGLSLLEKQEFSEGVKELEKALDLGRGANPELYMVDKIWESLAKAKHMKWELESVKRSWELQMLRDACETAFEVKHAIDISQIEGPIDEAVKSYSEQFAALDRVFDKAAEDDIPTEVPDYLCCRISLDILRDPVITPSGFTYERAVILEHLQKVGYFDPITREPLDPSQLISNFAIKEAVEAFLAKNGWAYG
ncbi:hypothetical protein Droror1_Dr00003893 [Drosera rotundifolia]